MTLPSGLRFIWLAVLTWLPCAAYAQTPSFRALNDGRVLLQVPAAYSWSSEKCVGTEQRRAGYSNPDFRLICVEIVSDADATQERLDSINARTLASEPCFDCSWYSDIRMEVTTVAGRPLEIMLATLGVTGFSWTPLRVFLAFVPIGQGETVVIHAELVEAAYMEEMLGIVGSLQAH